MVSSVGVVAASPGVQIGSGVAAAVVTLLGGWLIGTRVADHWADVRHRRELDLTSVQEFYATYGEMFAVQKLWDVRKRRPTPDADTESPSIWPILERAAAAEARLESLIMKLVLERHLDVRDRRLLGAFRQAYQTIRERIREDRRIEWWATFAPQREQGFREYRAFKALSTHFASLLSDRKRSPPHSLRWLGVRRRVTAPTQQEAQEALTVVTMAVYRRGWVEVAETELNLPPLDPGA